MHDPSNPKTPRTPRDQLPFRCPHCPNRGYASQYHLNVHSSTYCPVTKQPLVVPTGPTEDRPFFCDLCGNKSFKRNADYQKHLVTYHPETRIPSRKRQKSRSKTNFVSRSKIKVNRNRKRKRVNDSEEESCEDLSESSASSESEETNLKEINIQEIPKSTRSLRTRAKFTKLNTNKVSLLQNSKFKLDPSLNFNVSLVLHRLKPEDYVHIKEEIGLDSETNYATTTVPVITGYRTLAFSRKPADSSVLLERLRSSPFKEEDN